MGLEVVVNEIIAEGRKEAAAIEKVGLEEAKALLEEARTKADKILSERKAQAERETERIQIQETARAEFEAKKKVLVAKRALWDRLRADALSSFGNLPDDARGRILKTLLAQASKEIPEGTVHVRAADVSLVQGASAHTVVGDLDAVGGLVVEDATGSVSLDHRFESLLADIWPTVLKEESAKLFG